MHLTSDEERTLLGEEGPGRQKAMELLVALGDIYEADSLIPVSSAQVSGASFKTIGEAGIAWLESMSEEARATVPSMVNPLGLDLERWRSMGIPEHFHEKQARIVAAYDRMGLEPVYSCTPYLAGHRPRQGEHLAWAESSATVFANSFIGARTNREGGPSALAAAIIGKTPNYGLHLDENRVPRVEVVFEQVEPGMVPVAGYLAGRTVGNRVPLVRGIDPSEDSHKAFGAAMAATGAVSAYAFERPDGHAGCDRSCVEEKVVVGGEELRDCLETLRGGGDWDLVAIGCPHCSGRELESMARKLEGKRPRGDSEVWFCTSRKVYASCPEAVAVLRRFGKVLCDTCMVVSPIEELFEKTATNSGKAMAYLPTLGRQRASFRTTDELLEAISR